MKKVWLLILAAVFTGSFILGTTVTAQTTFSDVAESFWAKDDINYLSGKKVINGYSNGNFGPNDTIKRVDAAITLT